MSDLITAPLNTPLDAPRNGLEQVIEAAMADPAHWRAFEALLPTVDLFLAPDGEMLKGIEPGATGMRTMRTDQAIDVKGVTLDDGRVAAGVFTDPERLKSAWGEDTVFIAMNGHQVLALFRDGPIILNPGSPRILLFQKDDIAALLAAADKAAGQGRQAGGRPTGTVQLGAPDIEPTVLLERLKAAFGPVGGTGITAAWLARAHWAEVNRWGWYVDVRTARPMDEIQAMVGRAVTGVSFGQETLDVAVDRPGTPDGVGLRIV